MLYVYKLGSVRPAKKRVTRNSCDSCWEAFLDTVEVLLILHKGISSLSYAAEASALSVRLITSTSSAVCSAINGLPLLNTCSSGASTVLEPLFSFASFVDRHCAYWLRVV